MLKPLEALKKASKFFTLESMPRGEHSKRQIRLARSQAETSSHITDALLVDSLRFIVVPQTNDFHKFLKISIFGNYG
jgi:hypothetical protein